MPGMDGYEVCSRLKGSRKTRDIPVIFVTSMTDVSDEAKGLTLGAVDYIAKPVSAPIVQARVRAHLELKRAREALVRQNEELEERVVERTERIVLMQREREEGLRNFASAVAHQLRNPVQAIAGMSGLMLKKLDPADPVAEYAEAVREGCLRLEGVADAVAEYTALAPGAADMVAAGLLAEDVEAEGRNYAREKGVDWICRLEVREALLDLDAGFAVRALVELVKNAVDFSADQTARVRILGRPGRADMRQADIPFVEEASESGGPGSDEAGSACGSPTTPEEFLVGPDRYVFTVEDRGPGVPDNLAPFVFDPFFSTKALGVGMGLTMAARIARELGGTLRIVNMIDSRGNLCGFRASLDVAIL